MKLDLKFMTGMAAGALTTISFLPQLIKVIKTRSTHDISLGMFALFCTGVCLWLLYGIMLNEAPIILFNSITLVLAAAILGFKIKYK
jgi:MtN3 and saliva related transmembrane protein